MVHLNAPVVRYMSSPAHTLPADADLQEAERRLAALGISSLPVVIGNQLVGVISRTDLLRVGRMHATEGSRRSLLKLPHQGVREVMKQDPICVLDTEPVSAAARLIVQHHVHRVFVVDGTNLLGVLSTRDVMHAVKDARVERSISSLMSSPVLTVDADAPVAQAVDLLAQAHIHGLVVVDGSWPVGLFTQIEALEARDQADNTTVEEVMSYALLCLPPQTQAYRAAAQMAQTHARRVVVVDHRQVLGILTGIDMAALAI